MTGTIPFFAFGIASIATRLNGRSSRRRYVFGCIALVLIAWNVLFMAQYRLGLIPAGEALTLREMTIGKGDVFRSLTNVKFTKSVEPVAPADPDKRRRR